MLMKQEHGNLRAAPGSRAFTPLPRVARATSPAEDRDWHIGRAPHSGGRLPLPIPVGQVLYATRTGNLARDSGKWPRKPQPHGNAGR